MKMHRDRFAQMLDRLSGTQPNDERISRINERGFALAGLFYIPALAVRGLYGLLSGSMRADFPGFCVSGGLDAAVLAVMLLVLAVTAARLRSRDAAPNRRLHLKELPRAAAALLCGKDTEDERTVRAFVRGFAVCALIGAAYFGVCFLLAVWNRFFWSTLLLLCAAPVLLGLVKERENILTPPRAANIRLDTKHFLLRLPVYLLAVLPFLIFAGIALAASELLGGQASGGYSDNLFVMFFQVLGDAAGSWLRKPWHIPRESLRLDALLYFGVVLFHEAALLRFRRQMRRMDEEENDLS